MKEALTVLLSAESTAAVHIPISGIDAKIDPKIEAAENFVTTVQPYVNVFTFSCHF